MSTPAQRMERELRRLVEDAEDLEGTLNSTPDIGEVSWWIGRMQDEARGIVDRARRIPDLARLCPRCAGEGECPCP